MKQLRKAILDTSPLICLYNLNILSNLNLIYEEVRIPRAVQEEFFEKVSENEKTKRFQFLSNFYAQNNSWFIPCNEYGEDLVQIYLADKKMDRGESEALAQNQFYDSLFELILDEKVAREIAKNNSFEFHGVLYILAILSIKFGIIDYRKATTYLKNEQNFRLNEKIIEKAYQDVYSEIFS